MLEIKIRDEDGFTVRPVDVVASHTVPVLDNSHVPVPMLMVRVPVPVIEAVVNFTLLSGVNVPVVIVNVEDEVKASCGDTVPLPTFMVTGFVHVWEARVIFWVPRPPKVYAAVPDCDMLPLPTIVIEPYTVHAVDFTHDGVLVTPVQSTMPRLF